MCMVNSREENILQNVYGLMDEGRYAFWFLFAGLLACSQNYNLHKKSTAIYDAK